MYSSEFHSPNYAFIGLTIPNTDEQFVFKAAPFFVAWSPGYLLPVLSRCEDDLWSVPLKGGVIGIRSRHFLIDGSILTQPENSSWFTDVGWKVENYGTEPDIEVEMTPTDWVQGKDSQLERALKLILEQLAQNSVKLPDFGDRPQLKLPN